VGLTADEKVFETCRSSHADACRSRHTFPTLVLSAFFGIDGFVSLQPESKPVNVSLLRGKPLLWLFQDMLAIGDLDEIDRPALLTQRRIDFPFLQYGIPAGVAGFRTRIPKSLMRSGAMNLQSSRPASQRSVHFHPAKESDEKDS
jgi:hypothetical protein